MTRQQTIERRTSTPPATAESATILAFPAQPRRPSRQAPASDETRGQILLFLGVRYERLAS